jgi:L-iditol 2-dehydrogenase
VLVIGLGAMGMMHLLLARTGGAGLVLGADRVATRLARAAQFGADAALNADASLRQQVLAATEGGGAEIVFVTPGSRAALDAAIACLAPGGSIVVFTPLAPQDVWPVDMSDLFFKDVSIVTSYSAGPDDTRAALALLSDGLGVAPLFTHRFGLDEAAQAYALMKQPEEALKVVVYPQESRLRS